MSLGGGGGGQTELLFISYKKNQEFALFPADFYFLVNDVGIWSKDDECFFTSLFDMLDIFVSFSRSSLGITKAVIFKCHFLCVWLRVKPRKGGSMHRIIRASNEVALKSWVCTIGLMNKPSTEGGVYFSWPKESKTWAYIRFSFPRGKPYNVMQPDGTVNSALRLDKNC